MKTFACILYGAIVAHWLLHVRERVTRPDDSRFCIVARHRSIDEFVPIGYCQREKKARSIADYIETESDTYIGLVIDSHNSNEDMESWKFTNDVDTKNDVNVIDMARGQCDTGW